MRMKKLMNTASLAGILAGLSLAGAQAQSVPGLTGQVTSAEEGAMEGVLVSAKKDGANITTTVVTNDKGAYSFPADRLDPGHYTIADRAAGGYRSRRLLTGSRHRGRRRHRRHQARQVEKSGERAVQRRMADQRTGRRRRQGQRRRLRRLPHAAASFHVDARRRGVQAGVPTHGQTYSPGSTPLHPQPLLPGPRGMRPPIADSQIDAYADWLASVNMSATDTRAYEFKTLPRPKGKSTKVIYTEYDLPRQETQPHDVIVDQDGQVWYSDFSNQFAGVMDPKTGKATEIAIPVLKPEQPRGGLDIEFEPGEKNVWLSLMYQAGVARIDRKTHEVTMYPVPKEWQSNSTQNSMVSPQHADVDGKVWTNNQEMHGMYRIDLKTGQYEDLGQSKDPGGRQVSAYGMPTDQYNNVYQLEFGGTSIGYRDMKSGLTTIYRTPINGSRPRRGRVDSQNRLWFAEYGGNAIAEFDPQTAAVKEYPLPTKWGDPYDVVPTKDASQVWTGSMVNDRVARLDTKSGQITEYLMPRPTNVRRVFVQETGPRPVLWVGSNHGASIVKVEPLE